MPFDSLCKKVQEDAFDGKKYCKTDERKFFEFDKSLYKWAKEQSEVVKLRTSTPEPIGKTAMAEIKLGWMCGMSRDYLVQRNTNYSELMRNNCVFRQDVGSRLEEAQKLLSEK